MFVKAERKKSKLRLSINAPSGAGKTFGALTLAKGMGGKTALIDTENGSASLYSDRFDFDVLELRAPYSPERFVEAIKAAEAAGYDNLVIDSASHEWSGSGGCLEINEEIARSKYKGNTWSAWNDTGKRHKKFVDAILQSNMHVICTMRSKTETSQVEDNGRKKVVKLGMKAEQRDGMEYEFTTVLDLVHDGHFATATKDRTGIFTGQDPKPITEQTGKDLVDWLERGVVPQDPKLVAAINKANEMADVMSGMDDVTMSGYIDANAAIFERLKNYSDAYDIVKGYIDGRS